MPDMTQEVFFHCQSSEEYETVITGSKNNYIVRYGYMPHGKYQFDYTCTCHAFKFGKGKPCKHIEQVKKSGQHCKWTQFTDGGEVVKKNGEFFCPHCGLPAIAQRWAV